MVYKASFVYLSLVLLAYMDKFISPILNRKHMPPYGSDCKIILIALVEEPPICLIM